MSGERDGVMVRVSRGVRWHLHEIRHCVQDGLRSKVLRLGEDREVVRHEDAILEDVRRADEALRDEEDVVLLMRSVRLR